MRSGASGFISLFVTPVSVGDIVMENVDPTCCKRTGEGTQEDGRVRDVKAFKVKRTGEEGARSNFLGVSRGQQRADARRAVAIANEGSSKDCSSMAVSQGENIGKVAEEVFTAMMFLGPVKQQPPECAANGGGDGAARRESLCSWMMSLTEKNMKKLYEENWGWDEKKKLRELRWDDFSRVSSILPACRQVCILIRADDFDSYHCLARLRSPQARFIVAWMLPPECGGNAQIDPAGFEASEGGQLFGTHPVGFVHYRFIEDDARAVRDLSLLPPIPSSTSRIVLMKSIFLIRFSTFTKYRLPMVPGAWAWDIS